MFVSNEAILILINFPTILLSVNILFQPKTLIIYIYLYFCLVMAHN